MDRVSETEMLEKVAVSLEDRGVRIHFECDCCGTEWEPHLTELHLADGTPPRAFVLACPNEDCATHPHNWEQAPLFSDN